MDVVRAKGFVDELDLGEHETRVGDKELESEERGLQVGCAKWKVLTHAEGASGSTSAPNAHGPMCYSLAQ